MLKEIPLEYTPEEIGDFARANASWFSLAALTYCRDFEISPEAYWTYYGNKFASAWGWVNGTDELVFAIIGNVLSIGFELLSVNGDGYEYTVEVSGWPSEQECEYFDLTPADTDAIWNIFLPITDAQGHDFFWKREDDKTTFTVIRR